MSNRTQTRFSPDRQLSARMLRADPAIRPALHASKPARRLDRLAALSTLLGQQR